MLHAHLIRHGGVKAQDVAEALDELQRWVSELARRSRFMGKSVGPASAVLFDSGDRLQDLMQGLQNNAAFMYQVFFLVYSLLRYFSTPEALEPVL